MLPWGCSVCFLLRVVSLVGDEVLVEGILFYSWKSSTFAVGEYYSALSAVA
ncbi:hypothetical protein HMPREF1869_01674 [Bacteroidales bacterium KA00251]|nr:hypothetical protein HMPREF1869_01674 [Bacteroidales bacterium KA00251]